MTVCGALAGIVLFMLPSTSETSSMSNFSPATTQGNLHTTATRSYQMPNLHGDLIPFCLLGVSKCGREAADVFCRGNGFREALTFRRNSTQPDALLHFSLIKCWQGRSTLPVMGSNTRRTLSTETVP